MSSIPEEDSKMIDLSLSEFMNIPKNKWSKIGCGRRIRIPKTLSWCIKETNITIQPAKCFSWGNTKPILTCKNLCETYECRERSQFVCLVCLIMQHHIFNVGG